MRSIRALIASVVLALAVTSARAQPADDVTPIQTIPVAPGLAMLVGRGGNVAVSTGRDGPMLVDDQFAHEKPLADLDAAWGQGFMKADQVVKILWLDLGRKR